MDPADGHGIVGNRRIGVDVCKTVLHGILRHHGGSQNDGDVVLGLLGQVVAPVELPEIGIAGALHGTLHIAWSPVITSHGQVPVAKLLIVLLDLAGVGACSFLRIETLVHPPIALQTIRATEGHELPHAPLRLCVR